MISQNRADEKRQVLADDEWKLVQIEQQQNVDLLSLSHQLLDLTKEVHRMTSRLEEFVDSSGRRPG